MSETRGWWDNVSPEALDAMGLAAYGRTVRDRECPGGLVQSVYKVGEPFDWPGRGLVQHVGVIIWHPRWSDR